MDDTTEKLLSGRIPIQDIADIPARIVRVFLSSAAEGKK
jgi:hypothetical protein